MEANLVKNLPGNFACTVILQMGGWNIKIKSMIKADELKARQLTRTKLPSPSPPPPLPLPHTQEKSAALHLVNLGASDKFGTF